MTRSQRNYELVIGTGSTAFIVRPPMRVVFRADKTDRSTLQRLNLQIYNLNRENRANIVKGLEETGRIIPVVLKAGFVEAIETIFTGSIRQGLNERRSGDIVSVIEALDGGDQALRGFVSKTVTTKEAAIDAATEAAGIGKATITPQVPLTRPKVMVASSLDVMRDAVQPDERFYVDNEQAYVVKKTEVLFKTGTVVSPETGLINTPERDYQTVSFDTLLNPSIRLGGVVELRTTLSPEVNGLYKVRTISYSGDYDGNDWTQTVTGIRAEDYSIVLPATLGIGVLA